MIKALLHWWRLRVERSGKDRMLFAQPRDWRVRYNDGGRTAPMAYDTACDYAEMFGGRVERFPVKEGE